LQRGEKIETSHVSIIVLNWNGWRDTIECLESIYQITYPEYDVIVVDNNSDDDSLQKIREYAAGLIRVESDFIKFRSDNKPIKVFEYCEGNKGGICGSEYAKFPTSRRLILVKNNQNYGFAKGNNIGIKWAIKNLNPEYIMLLNNDTVVDKNFVNELIAPMKLNKKLGIVGPENFNYYAPKIRGCSKGIIGYWTGVMSIDKSTNNHKKPSKNKKDIFITGTCICFSKHVINNVGFLDEIFYFGGGEDIDICIRAANKGYEIASIPSSIIWHKGEARIKSKTRELHLNYIPRNYFILIKKHWSICQSITSICCMLCRVPVLLARYIKYYKGIDIKFLIDGIFKGIRCLCEKKIDNRPSEGET